MSQVQSDSRAKPMKLLFWATVLVIAAVAALFAVSNRETVSLALWPFPFLVELPLYLAVLASLLLGFVLGQAAGWIGAGRLRRELRRAGRRIAALERELAATQGQLDPAPEANAFVPRLATRS